MKKYSIFWIVISLFCNASDALEGEERKKLADIYNAALERQFVLSTESKWREAFDILSGVTSICERFGEKCMGQHIDRLIFLEYEAGWIDFQSLSNQGKYKEAYNLIASLTPLCMRLGEQCMPYHTPTLNNAEYMKERLRAHELGEQGKPDEELKVLKTMIPIAEAIGQEAVVNHKWTMALALERSGNVAAAVSLTKPLIDVEHYSTLLDPLGQQITFLRWSAQSASTEFVCDEILRFSKRNESALNSGDSPFVKDSDLIGETSLLFKMLVAKQEQPNILLKTLVQLSEVSSSNFNKLVELAIGDLALEVLNRPRLATSHYRKAGISEADIETKLSLTIFNHSLESSPSLQTNSEPNWEEVLEAQLSIALQSLAADNQKDLINHTLTLVDTLMDRKLETIEEQWNFISHAHLVAKIFELSNPKLMAQFYSAALEKIAQFHPSFREHADLGDAGADVKRSRDYNLVLFRLHYSIFKEDALSAFNLAKESAYLEQKMFGNNAQQLLVTNSIIAAAAFQLGNEDAMLSAITNALKIESYNVANSGICLEDGFVFNPRFVNTNINPQVFKNLYDELLDAHIARATNFKGLEERDSCSHRIRPAIKAYLSLKRHLELDLDRLFQISQAADLTDLGVASEIGMKRASITSPEITELIKKYTAITNKIQSISGSEFAVLAEESYETLAASKSELYQKILTIDPQLVKTFSTAPLSIAETQNYLPKNTALVKFVDLPGRGMFAWVLTKNNIERIELAKESSELEPLITGIRASLDQSQNTSITSFSPYDLESAHKLYLAIWQPLEKHLSTIDSIYVIPDNRLRTVPFAIIPTSVGSNLEVKGPSEFYKYRSVSWLSDRHLISYLPSVRSLKKTNRSSKNKKQGFLGIGDPKLIANNQVDDLDSVAQEIRFQGFANSSLGILLPELPETRHVIKALEQVMPGKKRILLGKEASETSLSKLELTDYSVVAFATHGLLQSQFSHEPALVLSTPVTSSVKDDGLLTASEISRKTMAADLVILSACNTATSSDAQGLKALSQSFLRAGTSTVIASHWPVESNSTTRFFSYFANHRGRFPSEPVSKSLHKAKRMLMLETKSSVYAHPSFWGAFTATGKSLESTDF